jgi:hypothetical protein
LAMGSSDKKVVEGDNMQRPSSVCSVFAGQSANQIKKGDESENVCGHEFDEVNVGGYHGKR